jgi:glucose/arabinose dehydrogenase
MNKLSAFLLIFLIFPIFFISSQGTNDVNQVYPSELLSFSVEEIESNLNHPWGMTFLNANNLLISERNGELVLLRTQNDEWNNLERYDLAGLPPIVRDGQGGILDLAYNPTIADDWIYISYVVSKPGGQTLQVARFTYDLNRNSRTIDNLEIIYEASPIVNSRVHFGSRFAFDPAGYLYISLGERGQINQSQNGFSSWGAILRLNLDGSIPGNNPFVNDPNVLNEIYSLGHRNPQGMVFDQTRNILWSNEHGPRGGDEVNRIEPGKNYGWPIITYGVNYNGQPIGQGTERAGLEQPLYVWDPSIAPSGMMVLNNSNFSAWNGDIFVGALRFQQIHRLQFANGQFTSEEIILSNVLGRIRTLIQGLDGNIWIITDEDNGKLYRLKPESF